MVYMTLEIGFCVLVEYYVRDTSIQWIRYEYQIIIL